MVAVTSASSKAVVVASMLCLIVLLVGGWVGCANLTLTI